MLSQSIQKELKNQQREMLRLLKRLAQIPSPSWHEDKRVNFCKSWLEKNGCEGVYVDDEYNVIYPYGVTDDNPIVVFAAHTDVVFPDTDRLVLTEDEECIYCPGIYDDTVNLVNVLLAARFVTQRKAVPDGVGLLFVCDTCEEGMGNLAGVRKLFEEYKGRIKEFYTFDLIYGEVVNHAVGSCRFRVTTQAEGGHSYLRFGRENAIQKMAAFIEDMYTITVPDIGKCTYNVGTITGGTSINTIAPECTVTCEYRSDSHAGMNAMDQLFKDLFKKHGVDYSVIGLRPSENLSDEAAARREAMLKNTERIIRGVTGSNPRRVSSSTDCNIPLSLGIPAICLGTCEGTGAHTRGEYLKKSSLLPGRMIVTELVLNYCKRPNSTKQEKPNEDDSSGRDI